MIYEISKTILNEKYNGNTPESRQNAINDGFFNIWTEERIKMLLTMEMEQKQI